MSSPYRDLRAAVDEVDALRAVRAMDRAGVVAIPVDHRHLRALLDVARLAERHLLDYHCEEPGTALCEALGPVLDGQPGHQWGPLTDLRLATGEAHRARECRRCGLVREGWPN